MIPSDDPEIKKIFILFAERVSPSGSSNAEIRNHQRKMSRENNRDQLPPGQPPPGSGMFYYYIFRLVMLVWDTLYIFKNKNVNKVFINANCAEKTIKTNCPRGSLFLAQACFIFKLVMLIWDTLCSKINK